MNVGLIPDPIADPEGSSTVLKFSVYQGDPDKFQRFLLRYKAYANAKGFADALVPLATNMPTSETDITDTDRTKIAAIKKAYVKANANAVSAYTLALERVIKFFRW